MTREIVNYRDNKSGFASAVSPSCNEQSLSRAEESSGFGIRVRVPYARVPVRVHAYACINSMRPGVSENNGRTIAGGMADLDDGEVDRGIANQRLRYELYE